eukprot:scaffold7344_cov145-Cylindrotheca_fusiformis.AAC.10
MSNPPPSNPPLGTHRKAASYGRGWFEGTMGVISGIAPRPMTPVEGNRPRMQALSAPNSPARGGFPGINRLPSQDSLDRSIHNESGHGKSTAQIIKDLKKANAELTNKTAEMEVKFMNELASVSRPFEEKQNKMKEMLVAMKKEMAQMEASKAASDLKLKEKDSQLIKIREESNFQRHTISDLKSQLHQLQSELDESEESNKGGEMEQLLAKNETMARELEELRSQAKFRDLKNGQGTTLPAESLKDESSDYFRQLEETQGELESHRVNLTATQQDLEALRREKVLWQEQSNRVLELEDELRSKSEQMQSMEIGASDELQDLIIQRDAEIASLNEQLDEYVEKTAELAGALAQVKEASANQEQYRRDEAEDLRILHDAQEGEITKLRKALEDTQKELEIKAEELGEKDRARKLSSDDLKEHISRLEKELDASQTALFDYQEKAAQDDDCNEELIMELENKLKESRGRIVNLEEEIELLTAETSPENIGALEQEIDDLKQKLRLSEEAELVAAGKLAELEDEFVKLQKQAMAANSDVDGKELPDSETKGTKEDNAEIQRPMGISEAMEAGDEKNSSLKKQLQETRKALVALDKEKEELIKKHSEVLSAVEKEKQDLQRHARQRLAAKDDELFVAIEQVANHQELESERDELENRVQSLEAQLAENNKGASSERTEGGEASQSQIDELVEEKNQLKNKLRDRDTTIAALVRSSMSVEEKIAGLEEELSEARSGRDDSRLNSSGGGEIDDLRDAVERYKANEESMKEEIIALEKDLNFAEAEAKRWQQALRADSTPGSDDRYQIAALQKNVAELKDKIKERDETIETISRSNSDPEFQRLQAENDMFAGQIVEQDEEIQNLIREVRIRDQSLLELERELTEKGVGGSSEEDTREIHALQGQLAEVQADLRMRNQQLVQYKQEFENMRQNGSLGGGELSLAAEVAELQDINDEYLMELRQLRTELWEAKEAAGAANDLRLELAQSKYAFGEYKRKQGSDVDTAERLRKELESTKSQLAQAQNLQAKLEFVKTDRASTETTLLESYERRIKEKDGVIATLKSDLELARDRSLDDSSKLSSKLAELENENSGLRDQFRVELHAKNQQIYDLEQALQAQEESVEKMRLEMEHLQKGMVFATERRHGDFEELQDEVFHMEQQSKKQEQEIENLRMKLDESKVAHRAEVSRLTDLVGKMDQGSPIAKTLMESESEDQVLEIRERLESLKKQNTKLQAENLQLRGRLERASKEIQSLAGEKQEVAEIEKDNRKLRYQLNEMEDIVKAYSQRPPRVSSIPLSNGPSSIESSSKPKKPTKSAGSFGGLFKKKKSKSKLGTIPTPVTPENHGRDKEDDRLQSTF